MAFYVVEQVVTTDTGGYWLAEIQSKGWSK